MLIRLWLQRGRLLVLLGAAMLAGVILVIDIAATFLGGDPAAIASTEEHATMVVAEILALAGIGLATILLSVIFPKIRGVADLLAIIIVLRALLWSLAPGLMHAMTSDTILNLIFFLGMGLILPRLIYSQRTERILPGDVLRREKRRILKAPIETVWAAISLAPHDPARHYDRTLLDLTPGPGGSLIGHYPTVPTLNGRHVRIVDQLENRSLRLTYFDPDTPDHRMEQIFSLVPRGDRTEVIWREAITRPLLIERLCHILDDDQGDDMHRLATSVEGRRDWSLYTAHFPHLETRPGATPPPLPA